MLFAATRQQIDVINARARYINNLAGRRVGKTIGVCRGRQIKRCIGTPGTRYTFLAPSYSQLWEEYDTFRGMEELAPHILKTRDQPYPHIKFRNGSLLAYRTYERPKNIRSKGEDEVWADECQEYIDAAEFMGVVRPLLSDRRGTLGFSGQPRGRNWVWTTYTVPGIVARWICVTGVTRRIDPAVVARWANAECYDGRAVFLADEIEEALQRIDPARPVEYATWITPSHKGLRFTDAEGRREIETARQQLPRAVYEQEFLCIPTASARAVFRAEDLDAVRTGRASASPRPSARYIIGLDLGRIADHTALAVLDVARAQFVHEHQFPLGARHGANANEVAALRSRWNDATVIVDVTGGATGGHTAPDEFVKIYQHKIPSMRRMVWNRRTKREMVEGFAVALEQRQVTLPADLRLLHEELAAYEYTARTDGTYDYHAPKGMHDDMCAAAFMAWYAHRRGFAGGGSGEPLDSVL